MYPNVPDRCHGTMVSEQVEWSLVSGRISSLSSNSSRLYHTGSLEKHTANRITRKHTHLHPTGGGGAGHPLLPQLSNETKYIKHHSKS